MLGEDARDTDEMFQIALDRAMKAGHIGLGDLVVITAGVPVGRSGTTNLIKIHQVGDTIAKGQGIGSQSATGVVVTARTPEEAVRKAVEGCILVAPSTDRDYMPAIEKAAAVITETGGITSHAAVVCIELGKPAVIGVHNALDLLQDGMEVSIYGEVGIIRSGKSNVL